MKAFKVNQKVVCVMKEKWDTTERGPSYNEIVTVGGICSCRRGFYSFIEYNGTCFNGDYFEPLITDTILEKELEEIFMPVENEMSMPINYKKWKIDYADSYTRYKYKYVHTDYDGWEDDRVGYADSLRECYSLIDEYESDFRDTLLNKAYMKMYGVMNDYDANWQPLLEMTNEQLGEIIYKKINLPN